jgi:hypothetical protein
MREFVLIAPILVACAIAPHIDKQVIGAETETTTNIIGGSSSDIEPSVCAWRVCNLEPCREPWTIGTNQQLVGVIAANPPGILFYKCGARRAVVQRLGLTPQ